jgi:hypothetical protein
MASQERRAQGCNPFDRNAFRPIERSNAARERRKRSDTSSIISLDCFRRYSSLIREPFPFIPNVVDYITHPPDIKHDAKKRKRQILRERIIDCGQKYLSGYSVDVGASYLSIYRSALKILDVFPIRKADLFELSTSKRRDIKVGCEAIDTISQISSLLISAFSVNSIALETKPIGRL